MNLRLWALALSFIFMLLPCTSSFAATLGPASSYDELRELIDAAQDGDTILVRGSFSAADSQPLSPGAHVRIASADGTSAAISGLRLRDASVSFSNITLEDSLIIDGTSDVQLASGVSVRGSSQSGLVFSGSGTLIVDRGCTIEGGSESAGVSISHYGGEFYSSIDGSVRGGEGGTGGAGVEISPLSSFGAVMISGSIQGGNGESVGGHALNLYDLSGNAYITIDGSLQGGNGAIGGDGVQLVSANDNVTVGIGGQVKGGQGEAYGGDALMLMNAEGASSVNLSGSFSGGDASAPDGQPGTSLQLVGNSTSSHARVMDCILEDGRQLSPTPVPTQTPDMPDVTPLPEITFDPEQSELTPATPDEADESAPEETAQPSSGPTIALEKPDGVSEATPSEPLAEAAGASAE